MISFKKVILIIFVLNPFLFSAQKKEKDFYLIDSVNTEKLSAYDKHLLDSLLQVYHKEKVDSIKVYQLRLISENLFDQNLWPKYNRLFFQKLEGKTDRFSVIQRAYAYNNFGYEFQYIKNDLFNARKNYFDSYKIFKQFNEYSGLAVEINNLAYIYQHEGNIEEAIKLYSEALTIFEKQNNPKGLATEYLNLGDIYFKNNDYKQAEVYFKKALIYAQRSNSANLNASNIEANICSQLGLIARHKGNSGEAMNFFNRARRMYDSLGDNGKLALVTSNLAGQYYINKNLKESENKYLEAKRFAIRSGDNHVLSKIYNQLGDLYFETGNIQKSKTHSDSAYYFSKQIGYPEAILDAARRLSKLLHQQKDYQKAFGYLEEAYLMRDSIYNDNTRKASIKQQFKTEYEVKEIQLQAEQEKKDEQRKAEENRQKIIIYFVILAFISMSVVAYVVYRNYRSKKRSAIILEEMNRLVTEQKKSVEEKQKEVMDSIRYAKRIQNSLLATERYIDKNISRLKSNDKKDK